MYESIISGEMPWKGPNPEAELRKGRFATNVTRWASLSPSAKSLIGSLLQPNPRLRLTAEEALQHDWFQEASTDRPSPATRSTRKTTSTIQISMSVIQENFELSNIDGATTHSSVSSSMMSRRSSTRLALKTQEDSAPAVTAASIPEQSKGMHTRSETKKRPHSSAMQLAHSVSMRCDAATSDDLCEVVAEGMAPVKRTRTVVQRSIKNK
jgi:serine/threonine protein kinase